MGRLFDDRGNRMTPTHANKRGTRYRYYVTCALNQGRPSEVGSVPRVAAGTIEAAILAALRARSPELASLEPAALIERQLAPCRAEAAHDRDPADRPARSTSRLDGRRPS